MNPYRKRIHQQLGNAYENAIRRRIDIENTKIVIFSDFHRGNGDKTDGFHSCHQSYCNAIRYYHDEGFSIYLLGNIEKFNNNRMESIISKYKEVYEIERSLTKLDRLCRIAGNDDKPFLHLHNSPSEFTASFFRNSKNDLLEVFDSMILETEKDGSKIGELVLVHGPSGSTPPSDAQNLSLKRFWSSIRRFFFRSIKSPANDFNLRLDYDKSMYQWIKHKPKRILITGCTHHPVFMSQSQSCRLRSLELNESANEPINTKTLSKGIADRIEILISKQKGYEIDFLASGKPAYFNTGCCCFPDGSITGIEINEGKISLIQWHKSKSKSNLLPPENLEAVFEQV